MKIGIIYKATSPSGKVYIGQTIQSLNSRKNKHINDAHNKKLSKYNTKFSRAIRKYNKRLTWIILYNNILQNKLDKLEIKVIKKYNSYKKGYNSTAGGNGCPGFKHSKNSRDKISVNNARAMLGKKHTKETKSKISKALKGRLGKKHSKNAKKKISLSKLGENNPRVKLTDKQVSAIRKEYRVKRTPHSRIAKRYGVSRQTISRIINYTRRKIPTR